VGGSLWLNRLNEIPENWYPSKVEGGIYLNSGREVKTTIKFMNFEI